MKSTPHHEDSADYVIVAAMQDAADDERFTEKEVEAFISDFGYEVRQGLPREIETTNEADELYERAYDAARQLTYHLASAASWED